MDIPIVIFLVLYVAIIFVVLIFSIFNLYHALRFGMHTRAAYAMSSVYVIVVSVILLVTWLSLKNVDWSGTFTVELPTIGTVNTQE